MSKKNCLLILEYGIPVYRYFVYDWMQKEFDDFFIIHSGERFKNTDRYNSLRAFNIKLFNEISLCVYNYSILCRYDLVITTLNFRKPHTWLPFIFTKKYNWIMWGQGPGKSKNFLLVRFKRWLINKSIGYVVYNDQGKEELKEIGVDENKVSIAYNTLRVRNSGLTVGDKYFLYVGRLQRRKGLIKLIKAISKTGHKLVLVGGAEDQIGLKELVLKLNIEKQVRFLGPIYDEDELKEVFSKAIAYVSPNHVGLGVVHAFSYGVPVITYKDRNHAPEFLYCNDKNSYLLKEDEKLDDLFNTIVLNPELHLKKRNAAHDYFSKKLNFGNVIEAFKFHLNKLN